MRKIIFSLVLFLLGPMMAWATSYDITDFKIQAYIREDGSVDVNEIIVLDGEFNGYERDLSYMANLSDKYETSTLYQGTSIENLSIMGRYIDNFSDSLFDGKGFTTFNEVKYASNGDIGKYILTPLSGGKRVRMYYKSPDKKVAFYLKYTIKDLVVKHSDVAEFYFPFIGDNFEDDINNVDIKVYLPRNSTTDNTRVWAHGVLYGEVEKIGNIGLHAYAEDVPAGEVLDVRMTFDSSLVTPSKNTNEPYFDQILKIENLRSEDANNLRKSIKFRYNLAMWGTICFYILLIILWIYVFLKYGKNPKSSYYSKYNREFIDDYNVEVIDYLMNKRITPNAMSASIMNLIYKKNIKVEEINVSEKKKDYIFTLENRENINESEEMLIDFLFLRVGNNKKDQANEMTFSLSLLKNYAKGTKTCDKFLASYTKWKNSVVKKGQEEGFFEKHTVPIIIGICVFIVGVILFIFGVSNGVDFIPLFFIPLVIIVFMFYTMLVDKKTIKGVEHYARWRAFKNFLNDFGSFNLKELPEIVLWERYLVYATIFGLASHVQKAMNVHIKELDVADYDYYPSFYYFNLGSTINSSINSAISSAQAATIQNSSSSFSSGGGFGGGFSGGSGFSGGGGGRGF